MMLFPHHVDASSVLLCLLGNRRKPEGRREGIISSLSHGEAYQTQKPRLYRVQGELELVDLVCNPLTTSILKQLVHWNQRVSDFKLFVAEEKRASLQDLLPSFFYHGWPTKSAQELLKKPWSVFIFLFSIIIEEFLCLEL